MPILPTISFWRSLTFVKVLFVCAIGAMFLVTEGVKQYSVKRDLQLFQGEWTLESSDSRFQTPDEPTRKSYLKTITGDHFTVTWHEQGRDREQKSTMTLDPTQDPKAFDLVTDLGDGRMITRLGIYKIDADTHTVCYSEPGYPRPANFDSEQGSLNVWRRAR